MFSIGDFKTAQKELIEATDNFPEEKLDKRFYGDWAIKEVIGHISAWDKYFTKVLNNHKNSTPTKHWGNINEFNKVEVEKRKNSTLIQLKKELKVAGNDFVKVYTSLNKQLLNRKKYIQLPYANLKKEEDRKPIFYTHISPMPKKVLLQIHREHRTEAKHPSHKGKHSP